MFFPFSPTDSQNKILEKMKKMPEDSSLLHMCIINENCMTYCC